MEIIVYIFSAILAGMGIGGGAIFVLITTLVLGFEQKMSQALNLIMFIAVGVSATISNIKDKKIEFNLTKKILPGLIFGALVGTGFAKKITNNSLKNYFSAFLVCIGIYEIITSLINIKKAKNNNNSKK